MDWWQPYIGLPFGEGQGRETCWSLVRRIYTERLGIDLPAYGETSSRYMAAIAKLRRREISPEDMQAARYAVAEEMERGRAAEAWRQVSAPEEMDVVLMKNVHSRRIGHVGLMVDSTRMMHVESATGVVVVPVHHLSVAGRIVGYWRLA